MDEFYVMLPSNSPVVGNKTSSFVVRLPEVLELDNNWSVALSSIIYPNSFPTIGIEEKQFVEIDEILSTGEHDSTHIELPSVTVKNVEQLEHEINSLIAHEYELAIIGKGRALHRAKRSADIVTPKESEDKETPVETPKESKDQETPVEVKEGDKITPPENPTPLDGLVTPIPRTDEEKASDLVEELSYMSGGSKDKETPKQISEIDKLRIDAAKRASDRALKKTIDYANEAHDISVWTRSNKKLADNAIIKAPNAPNVQEAYAKLLQVVNNIYDLERKISNELTKATDANKETISSYRLNDLKKAKVAADKAKLAENAAKEMWQQIRKLYHTVTPETELGANELANRVVVHVNSFLEPPATPVPAPAVEPPYPPGHPKLSDTETPVEEKPADQETPKEVMEEGEPDKDADKEKPEISPVSQVDDVVAEVPEPVIKHKKPEEKKPAEIIPVLQEDEEVSEVPEPVKESKRPKIPQPILPSIAEEEIELPIKEKIEQTKDEIETIGEKLSKTNIPVIIDDDEKEEELPPLPKPQALSSSDSKVVWDSPKHMVSFHYNKFRQKFETHFRGSIRFVIISKQLAYTLGYEKQQIYEGDEANYSPDISGGLNSMIVYAPGLVENSIIGDTTAPFLRVINVSGSSTLATEEKVFNPEYFYRLHLKRISEIHIQIRTLTGTLVPFSYGNVIVTLHFKRSLF